jgi:hypothetical protein
MSDTPFSPRWKLCRNLDRGWISTEQAVRLLSFRIRPFKGMGNRPSKKWDSFRGLGALEWSDERLPV